MSLFNDTVGQKSMGLAPGARNYIFHGENMLFSPVEIDANSDVPPDTHSH